MAWTWIGQALASSIDLSKAANMGPGESFDEVSPEMADAKAKSGFASLPTGQQTFRGVPFLMMDPGQHGGHSFVVLKGRHKPEFPEGVSIPAGGVKAATLYFLHTCRWGGTASNITVAEYDVVYDDGQIAAIPLRVGVELTNFFNPDDTAASTLAWWYKYKNIEMGVNFFPWKNPHPEKSIQSILFKSRGNMPVPILFAITASDKELPISADSPKPEKTFQTDTSKWMPLEPSDSFPVSTAINMSFLLDAPAGKHGQVKADGDKLIFEDGTPARFWGVRVSNMGLWQKTGSFSGLADILAKLGCNAVILECEITEDILKVFKEKGIYIFADDHSTKVISPVSTAGFQKTDPAIVEDVISNWARFNKKISMKQEPIGFNDTPTVMSPSSSYMNQMCDERYFGKTFGIQWGEEWPNEYISGMPILMASFAADQGWNASFGIGGGIINYLGMYLNEDIFEKPSLYVQWPTAALAYLRGDLKEGKVFVLDKDSSPLKALAHKSGLNPEGGKFKTDRSGELKAKVNEKTKSFVSDTGQISWQGNVGVVKVEAPRFQALIGFLSHRKFNNAYWAVETPNSFASLSAISLSNKALNVSDHLLLTGVTRMENTGQVYNEAKTKLLSAGKAPILVEPLAAKIVLYRFIHDSKLKIRALDASGQPIKVKVPAKWVKNSFVFSWVPSAFYLEIYK